MALLLATARGKGRKAGWKGAALVMTALFVFAAAVQYNDPDGALWMAVYGAAALLNLLFITTRVSWLILAVASGIALLWAGTIIPEVWGQVSWRALVGRFSMKTEAIEKTREMVGLLIIAVWTAVQAAVVRRQIREERTPGGRNREEA